nr:heme o synthase [Actinoplanes sp. N902-109]
MITERPASERVLAPRRDARAVFAAYLSLTKPQIVELLLVTTIPTMMFAAGGWPDLGLMAVVLIGGALAAGAASTFNCYIDRDIDQLMRRTKRRPLPSHVVTPRAVLIFGTVLTVVSLLLMAAFTNWLATAMTAASIFYYDVVYTIWLKRRTSQNTFWGGVCGAAPVLIAWAAVQGTVGPIAWALFAVVFFWQMPHFYPLAIKYKDDYARAGIPMLPVVRSARRVNTEILLFTVLTIVSSLAAWPLGLGPVYGITAVVAGGFFLMEALVLVGRSRRGEPLKAMRLFHWSITYLTILFIAVAVDALL